MKKNFRLKQAMIVEKEPSVFGYARKISTSLNLNYHGICKFKSKEDAIQRLSRDLSQTGRSIASVKTFVNTDKDPGSWDTDHIYTNSRTSHPHPPPQRPPSSKTAPTSSPAVSTWSRAAMPA